MKWETTKRLLREGRDRVPFVPFWRPIATTGGSDCDPWSWAFFVVAKINGRHRKLAVVSCSGNPDDNTVMRGWSMLLACHRLLVAFRDSANYRAIQAELALASGFYLQDDSHKPSETNELPEFQRNHDPEPRFRDLDKISASVAFPFITSCAFQAVATDPRDSQPRNVFIEPLSTVYRDTSLEWGMVVIDITNVRHPEYGIVAFQVAPMEFIPNQSSAVNASDYEGLGYFQGQTKKGVLRVMDEERSRKPISAANYVAKFEDEVDKWQNRVVQEQILATLEDVSVADWKATEPAWPLRPEEDASFIVSAAKVIEERKATISELVQRSITDADLGTLFPDTVKAIPDFQEMIRQCILENTARLTIPDGLIELAFLDQTHLSLEMIPQLPVQALSLFLDMPTMAAIESLSVCLDNIEGTMAQLVNTLAHYERLKKVQFMQRPGNPDKYCSIKLFEALATQPKILRRKDIVIAAAHAAGVQKQTWLPDTQSIKSSQLALLAVCPAQQIFIKGVNGHWLMEHGCILLGDTLLTSSRLVSGLLLFMQSILISDNAGRGLHPLYLPSLTCAPAEITGDTFNEAEVLPMPSESFALGPWASKANTLLPEGWTILIEAKCTRTYNNNPEIYLYKTTLHYAFVRPQTTPIVASPPPRNVADIPELEVCGFKEFLAITDPQANMDGVDVRLDDIATQAKSAWGQHVANDCVLLLSQSEATSLLLEMLQTDYTTSPWETTAPQK